MYPNTFRGTLLEYADELKQIQQVRHLIGDVDETNQLLTDDHIKTYLELNDWADGYKPGVYRATADALEAIATSTALLDKKIRTQDISSDGPAVSAVLMKQAAGLRARADNEDPANESFFEIIPFGGWNSAEGEEWRF